MAARPWLTLTFARLRDLAVTGVAEAAANALRSTGAGSHFGRAALHGLSLARQGLALSVAPSFAGRRASTFM